MSIVESAINAAMRIPGVSVDREEFLRTTFQKYGNTDKLSTHGPQEIYSSDVLDKVANSVIRRHTTEATALSAAAGIPGGFGAVPATIGDLSQFYAHLLIVGQKLGYVYGMEDLRKGQSSFDEESNRILIIMLGVAFGVEGANQVMSKIAKVAIKKYAKDVIAKSAEKSLAGVVSRMVIKIMEALGMKVSEKSASNFVGKAIPVVSGVISGAITYATFPPMARKLKKTMKDSFLSA